MFITTNNICHYLLAKGFVSSESVVDGDFAVVDVSGRNRNFKVIRKRKPSYFVKQIQHWDAQKIAMLQCEAACYWLAHNDDDFASLEPLMPEFHSYDVERQILITGLIAESENLYEYFRRVGKFSADVAAKLGAVLGTYHREAGNRLKDSPHSAIFPRQVPWILSADMRNSHPFKELSRATSQLFDVVEQSSELRLALDVLRTEWRAEAMMHGDMRWENCILFRSGAHGELSLKIVDWELADIGDACWDVGAIIQAFVSAQIVSLPMNWGARPAIPGVLAELTLNEMQPAIRSFWESYVDALRIEAGRSSELLERCIRYGAARMIQSAYEYMQFSAQVSPNSLHLLQLSADILKNPGEATRQLLNAQSA